MAFDLNPDRIVYVLCEALLVLMVVTYPLCMDSLLVSMACRYVKNLTYLNPYC